MRFSAVTLASLSSLTGAALVAPATSQVLPESVELRNTPLAKSPGAIDETSAAKAAPSPDSIQPESGLRLRGRRTTATSCFPQASKIKLQSSTGRPIQVLEVQVLASGSNIAEGKTATQGSTFKDKEGVFGPSMAVDGDNTTFSHTKPNDCAWIEVDFGGTFGIEMIRILNRYCGGDASDPKGCLCRLSHATISLLDEEGKWVDGVWLGNTCGDLMPEKAFTAICPAPPTISPVSTPEPTPSPTPEPTPSPTPEPTTSPSSSPSASPTAEPTPSPTPEPTPSPTPEPTTSPSSLPSTASPIEPTTAPTPTAAGSLSYVGVGFCENSSGQTYAAWAWKDMPGTPSSTDCIDWCLTPSGSPDPNFVGVTFSPFYKFCRCEHAVALPVGSDNSDYSPPATLKYDNVAYGAVVGGNGSPYRECYSYNHYSV